MLGVRLEPELEARLAAVAQAYGRTKSDIAREAVRRFVKEHDAAYRAECRRQSLAVAGEAEDGFWEDLGVETWFGGSDDAKSPA
jgi:RHH-type rel operon transcriptional repressor/antitoxin RelB